MGPGEGSSLKRQNETLFIIPCCKSKEPEGETLSGASDPMPQLIPQPTYRALLSVRKLVLDGLRGDPKYLIGKDYSKNADIKDGPDFGTSGPGGDYLPAVKRYVGKLYKGSPGLAESIDRHVANPDKPRVLILSALYGPLHPFSLIQDYNLQMSDRPAYLHWKEHFPAFLEEYVRRSTIREIRLYLAKTKYLEVAEPAVTVLKNNQVIDRGVHYAVKRGNSTRTPMILGRLALSHLEGSTDAEAEDAVVTREL